MSTQLASLGNVEPLEKLRDALVERINAQALDLPLLPQAASQVMSFMSDPNADATRLSSLIHQDQALAGHVLRIANSPAYMPRSPIVSLQQAVAWLGMNVLGEIAFTASLQKGVFRVQGYEDEIKRMWRHALITGLYAKEIARQRRHNVEGAFLCGLLHAIGKPVVVHALTDLQKALGTSHSWNEIHSLVEEYHIPVGGMIAEKWQLPAQVREAIVYYADYSQASSAKKAVMITCLASILATHLSDPAICDQESVTSHPVVHDLNLYPEDLTALLDKGEEILSGADSIAV